MSNRDPFNSEPSDALDSCDSEALLNRATEAFRNRQAPPWPGMIQTPEPQSHPLPRRFLLRAAAAVVFISAVGALIYRLVGAPGPTFAQVVEKVARLETVSYRTTSEDLVGDTVVLKGREFRNYSRDGRGRSINIDAHEQPTSLVLSDPKSDADLWLYEKTHLAEFIPSYREWNEYNLNGSDLVQFVREFGSKGARRADDTVYQGKKVNVFVADTSAATEFEWSAHSRAMVDKETGLPLLIEVVNERKSPTPRKTRWTWDQFVWNPTFPPDFFSMQPPDEYRVEHDTIRMLRMGLEEFSQLFDDKFPDQLSDELLAESRRRLTALAKGQELSSSLRTKWWYISSAFGVREYAIRHKLDFRYYGAGKPLNRSTSPAETSLIAAIERAPGSGTYDVYWSNGFFGRKTAKEMPELTP